MRIHVCGYSWGARGAGHALGFEHELDLTMSRVMFV